MFRVVTAVSILWLLSRPAMAAAIDERVDAAPPRLCKRQDSAVVASKNLTSEQVAAMFNATGGFFHTYDTARVANIW
jgi:hypothetical protein